MEQVLPATGLFDESKVFTSNEVRSKKPLLLWRITVDGGVTVTVTAPPVGDTAPNAAVGAAAAAGTPAPIITVDEESDQLESPAAFTAATWKSTRSPPVRPEMVADVVVEPVSVAVDHVVPLSNERRVL
ncbi:MAG: hypothetical protein RLZZ31_223 [Actinomycetota bacterium]